MLRDEGKTPAGQALPEFTAEPGATVIPVLLACRVIEQLRSFPRPSGTLGHLPKHSAHSAVRWKSPERNTTALLSHLTHAAVHSRALLGHGQTQLLRSIFGELPADCL